MDQYNILQDWKLPRTLLRFCCRMLDN